MNTYLCIVTTFRNTRLFVVTLQVRIHNLLPSFYVHTCSHNIVAFFRLSAMPKHSRTDDEEARPIAARPKAQLRSRPYGPTHESSRSELPRRNTTSFNVFPTLSDSHHVPSPQTDASDNKNRVVIRSNSEIRRENPDHYRRSDLTEWKSLTLPAPAIPNETSSVHLPERTRQPSQELTLPSSSSHTPPTAPTSSPPLSILYRQNGDQIINVHGAPPEDQKKWYLEVIRTIHPPEHSAPPIPIQLTTPQPVHRQRFLTDIDRSSSGSALPLLQLPDPSGQLSDSTRDADQPATSQYEVHVRPDAFSTVGNDEHQIHVRFLTEYEHKNIILQKSSTWVSWARMSIVEYKHHQFKEPGMQHIWCPNPYCWLLCTQFLQACTKQTAKDDFWFRLWHYFDQYKDEANRSTNRLSPAHEINLTFAVHHTLLGSNPRLIMMNKIVKGSEYPDVSNWTFAVRSTGEDSFQLARMARHYPLDHPSRGSWHGNSDDFLQMANHCEIIHQ